MIKYAKFKVSRNLKWAHRFQISAVTSDMLNDEDKEKWYMLMVVEFRIPLIGSLLLENLHEILPLVLTNIDHVHVPPVTCMLYIYLLTKMLKAAE